MEPLAHWLAHIASPSPSYACADLWKNDYARCDTALAYAQAAGAKFRGHALVWGKSTSNPDWFNPDCAVSSQLTRAHEHNDE